MTVRTVVTVGAGQVAAVAARTLRRRGFDGRIVLLGDEQHAPYQRPPLSKEFLAGREGVDSLALLTRKWLDANDIDIRTGVSVQRIDTATRTVEFDGGEIAADAIVLATGGRPRTLTATGSRPDLVHYLRTLDDATALAARLTPGSSLAIVGGGFIGLEIAATARSLGVTVTVLEQSEHLLGGILGEQVGRHCAELHRRNGVDLRTGTGVASVTTSDHGVRIETTTGGIVEADAVVVGIGIVPNTDMAAASGLAVDGGIVVDATGRTSVENIYAAGDVAKRFSPREGRHVRVEHFDNANRQAAVVADTIVGRQSLSDDPHWFWSDQYDTNIQFAGSASGTTELVVRGDTDSGEFSVFYLADDVLTAAFAMDRGEDIMAARELVGRRVDAALLADEDTDLWEMYEEVEPA
ncbi:NAD(P)/FAD-dependent oxidoreductase [Rhodococcus rhodochrous]|uniref:NAD(P)/FAD-dependent oxidoreductase n=1 Tax=Rhodococcus rhodochrous TaxID=1829 RepID=UPI001E2A50EB|nr:FAD-dependent oxidoreductase [Rhodococcus rhodochrous]MCD2098945.1 FAD-dependent oxidoreductase [Rhodococcus rhodochrous]MCD2123469.1 FAD-dependent oxidoreductase [Rhodococcus rhodochrous]MCQ4135116.1 FAD-dependent oxidoreductase [Rhodococcus rhodochrous]MDJ0020149.1 FAD-dependent oxidoreductase [Rhodococcus rhodochrous]